MSSWWSVGRAGIDPKKNNMTTPMVSHACEYETSMMLALRPDLVKLDRIRMAPPAIDNEWFKCEYGGRVSVYRRYRRWTAAGSQGSPDKASPEKGESMLRGVVHEVVTFLNDFAKWPELPTLGPK
jgi:creatinine amidohydrolase